eukprot:6176779-Pleurochrysis_carterae.AAC.1
MDGVMGEHVNVLALTGREADVVESGEETDWLALEQSEDVGVVAVLDARPRQALGRVVRLRRRRGGGG